MKKEDESLDLIEYKSQLNDVPFRKFKEADYNLFFTIILLAKNKLNKGNIQRDANNFYIVKIDYSDIKKLSGLGKNHIKNKEFNDKYLREMTEKLQDLKGTIKNGNVEDDIVLFPRFRRNPDEAVLTAFLTEDFYRILYDFDDIGFTQIELKKFVSLESKYSKTLFRKLSQFKGSGKYVVKQEDFRAIFDIPESYKQSDIMKRVINPALEELQSEFKDLKCELHYAMQRGKPVDRYTFTFTKPLREQKKTTEGQSDFDQAKSEMSKYREQKRKEKNSFNNFEQNSYDFEELERLLLDN